MTSGLNEHIKKKREIFSGFSAGETRRSTSRLSATAEVHDDSGVRRIAVRDFRYMSDSGSGMAGYDLGPSSPELFLSSLASCLCHIFLVQAAVRNVRLDAIACRAEASLLNGAGAFHDDSMPGYPHDISYTVDLLSEEPEECLLWLWEAVRAHCPIYLLISRAVPVGGTLRRVSVGSPAIVLGSHRDVEVQAAACRDRVDQGLQLPGRGRLGPAGFQNSAISADLGF